MSLLLMKGRILIPWIYRYVSKTPIGLNIYHANKHAIKSFGTTTTMPKSKGKVEKESITSLAEGGDLEKLSPVFHDKKKKSILIHILAKPGAKFNNITGITGDGIGVQIAAPPVDGEANSELIKFFSKVLEVKKSNISLDKGNKSRTKVLSVEDDCGLTAENILLKIQSHISPC